MSQTAELNTSTPPVEVPNRARLARYLVPVGMLSAIAGEYVLLKTQGGSPSEGTMLTIAGILLALGGTVFGIGAQASQSRHHTETVDSVGAAPKLWFAGMFWAAILAITALVLFDLHGEQPVVVAAWLGSILMIFAAQFEHIHFRRPSIGHEEWPYLAALLLLVLLALGTRTYHLATLPNNLDGDFASVGIQARALAMGEQRHIFTYGWANIPILGYLPAWLSMLMFGTGLAGLNASGVIEGLLIILGVYLVGRELFSFRAGLFAAALLTISYTHLAASRQSVYIDPAFFMLFAIYFVVIGLRRSQGWALVLSGVLTALCLEMYYAGRLIVPFFGLMLLYVAAFHRSWLLARWKSLAIWLAAVVITLGPMLEVFARDPGPLGAHQQEVFILDPALIRHMEGVYGVSSVPQMLWQQFWRTIWMFHYYPDKGTQFSLGLPYLDPLGGVLFALGLGYVLLSWRRPSVAWLGVWITLGMVLGCFLTGNPPFWPRLILLLPAVALVCGVALDILYENVREWFQPFGRSATISLALLIAWVFIGMGISNWNAYVAAKGTYATARTRIAKYMLDQPPSVRAYLVSDQFNYQDREFEFLIPGRLIGNLTKERAVEPIAPASSPTLIILSAEQANLATLLEQRYRGGPIGGNGPGEIAFYALRTP